MGRAYHFDSSFW